MILRLYVHNFGCLENFELDIGDRHSALLLGKNGTGKSTIRRVLSLLQAIARGTNRVGSLVRPRDCFRERTDEPVRLEIEALLRGIRYQYRLVLELPPGFKEFRVQGESLVVDGRSLYTREHALVTLAKSTSGAGFSLDWHLVALPIIQESSETDPLHIFKNWLASSIILAPIPALIFGESAGESLQPDVSGVNLPAWFAGLIAHAPAAYTTISAYLKNVMPDLWDIKNPLSGAETRSLTVQFRREKDDTPLHVPFAALSDGEKCYFLCALVLAANEAYGPLLCFWDEPDSHLSIDEVGHFVAELRRAFEAGGQVLMTSHNPETMRRFSDENTLLLYRRSHLDPTRLKPLEDLDIPGDRITAFIAGDIEP